MDLKVYVSVVLERDGKILLVQEQKKSNYGKWNLPGGHLEPGEKITAGALRELHEETHLSNASLQALLGLYSWRTKSEHALRYVFIAQAQGEPKAGDEILAIKWVAPSEVATMPDELCLGRHCLRQIVHHFAQGIRFPLDAIVEQD